MTHRVLSGVIALTFVLAATGPVLAAQPAQLRAARPGESITSESEVSQVPPGGPPIHEEGAGQFALEAPDAETFDVPASAILVSAGGHHTCALTDGGEVKCWGYNNYGQLGDGTVTTRFTAVDVSGLTSGVVAVTAGYYHICALTSSGGVKCWGDNTYGQLGDGTTQTRSTPVDVSGLTSGIVAVTAGRKHTCALTNAGGVKCWGNNPSGQLGNGTEVGSSTPVDVSTLTGDVVEVTAGYYHTCALTTGGGLKCWGFNGFWQLGDGTTTSSSIPVDVSGLASGVVAAAAGGSHSCALTSGGGVKCWGYNGQGQLGVDTAAPDHTPVDANGLTSGVAAVTAGESHSCALVLGGGVKCWGFNASGRLGDGTTTTRTIPVDVSGLTSGVAAVTAGGFHTCARMSGGGVRCWGHNAEGQLGGGTTLTHYSPVEVSGLTSGVVAVTAASSHSCVLTSEGSVKCWGDNSYGRLGDGTTDSRSSPADVIGLTGGMVAVTAKHRHTCGLTSGGGVKCWGNNYFGQLGDGTRNDKHSPVDVHGLTAGVVAVTAGAFHTCTLDSGGGVKCWGDDTYGQLGSNRRGDGSAPSDVSGLTSGVLAVTAGSSHTCALTTGGGVKCWGYNDHGQLGDGTTTNQYVPVDVSGLTGGVVALTAGREHTCALTTGGGIKCWGYNGRGELGDGTTKNQYAPVDVSGLTSGVLSVAAGGSHTCASTTGGRLKCWGENAQGELGDGTTMTRNTPVDVIGLTSGVMSAAAGSYHTCALTTSGGIKCWGQNEFGQLGVNPGWTPLGVLGFPGFERVYLPLAGRR